MPQLGSDDTPVVADNVRTRVEEIDDTDSPYLTQSENQIEVDTSGGAVTVTIASADIPASGEPGRSVTLVNTATNDLTIETEGSEQIQPDGVGSLTITTDQAMIELRLVAGAVRTDRNVARNQIDAASANVGSGTIESDATDDADIPRYAQVIANAGSSTYFDSSQPSPETNAVWFVKEDYIGNDNTELWSQTTSDGVREVAVDGSYAGVCVEPEDTVFRDATTGNLSWTYTPSAGNVCSNVDVSGDFAAVGNSDDNIYYVNVPNQNQLWSFAIGGNPLSVGLDVSNDIAVATSTTDTVFAIDTADGSELWSVSYSGPRADVSGQYVSVALGGGSTGYLLDASDGSELWSFSMGSEYVNETAVDATNGIAVFTTRSNVYAVDITDGSELWSVPTIAEDVDIDENAIIFSDGTNGEEGAVVLNGDDGSQAWKYSTTAVPTVGIDPSGGVAIVGEGSDNAYYGVNVDDIEGYSAIQISDGQAWFEEVSAP